MSTGKIDWKTHAAVYAAEYAPNGISIAEYAEQNGLNKNTARRYLRASDQQRDHLRDHPSDQATDHTRDQQPKKKPPTRKAAPAKASNKKRSAKSDATESARPTKKQVPYTSDHAPDNELSFVPRGNLKKRRPQVKVPLEIMRRIRRTGSDPNSHPITHGGYAELPDEMWDAAVDIPEDEIDLWNIRGAMATLMTLVKRRQELEDFYSTALPTEEDSDKPAQVQLLKTVCSGVDLEVMLRGYIRAQRQMDLQNTLKQLDMNIKLEDRQLRGTIQKQVKRILDKRDAEGTSAAAACRMIERIGGTVPASLLKEFEYELRNAPPPAVDDKSANPEDFNEQVEAYLAVQRSVHTEMLPERRSQVDQLVDELGYGDSPTDEASMLSVELQEADDGEEWEDEEDAALYDPDNNEEFSGSWEDEGAD